MHNARSSIIPVIRPSHLHCLPSLNIAGGNRTIYVLTSGSVLPMYSCNLRRSVASLTFSLR